jgi:predicted transcriptional regulator
MKQNVTVSLDSDLLHEAKVIAARRKTSLSRLLADEIADQVRRTREYEQFKRAAIAMLDEGLPLGGAPLSREQAHER